MSSGPVPFRNGLDADRQPQLTPAGARNLHRLLFHRTSRFQTRVSDDLAQNRGAGNSSATLRPSHLVARLAEHSFGRFARHEQPAGIVEKQNAFFQPLQQLLDVGPQFVGVLFRATVLFVQQAEFGVHVGELAGLAPLRLSGRAELAGADQIDASAHALQRVQNETGQHGSQKNCDAQRQRERQQ